jgi:hypothetical protein
MLRPEVLEGGWRGAGDHRERRCASCRAFEQESFHDFVKARTNGSSVNDEGIRLDQQTGNQQGGSPVVR